MRSLFIPVLLDGGREGGMKVGETGERRGKEGRKEKRRGGDTGRGKEGERNEAPLYSSQSFLIPRFHSQERWSVLSSSVKWDLMW